MNKVIGPSLGLEPRFILYLYVYYLHYLLTYITCKFLFGLRTCETDFFIRFLFCSGANPIKNIHTMVSNLFFLQLL